jgi:hypothetical protein
MKRVALCFDIYTKHTNALCERNIEYFNAKRGVKSSNHWVYYGLHNKDVDNTGYIVSNR